MGLLVDREGDCAFEGVDESHGGGVGGVGGVCGGGDRLRIDAVAAPGPRPFGREFVVTRREAHLEGRGCFILALDGVSDTPDAVLGPCGGGGGVNDASLTLFPLLAPGTFSCGRVH